MIRNTTRNRRTPLAAVCLFVAMLAMAGQASADEFYVAFWNVENLFDTVDDPNVKLDEEFTPTATKQWTEERFEDKLQKLARVISDMNGGHGPDVLGVAEVENRLVLEKLVEHLKPLGRDYDIVHHDSPSGRGIDCALLYDHKKFELKSSGFLIVHETTREIVEADLTAGGNKLFVFVNHWPSRGGDREGKGRMQAGDVLRKRIDEILKEDAKADIVVIGDLNDHPDDPSVSQHLRALKDADALKDGDLFNTTWAIHDAPDRGSYNYHGKWEIIDHVIISPGLLDEAGFEWKPGSTTEIRNKYQMYRAGTPKEIPSRTYDWDKYLGGYSDHLPVACVIEQKGP